jgi:hypothetical protein
MNIFISYEVFLKNKNMIKFGISELKKLGKVYLYKNDKYSQNKLISLRKEIIRSGMFFDDEIVCKLIPKELFSHKNLIICEKNKHECIVPTDIYFDIIILEELSGSSEKKLKKILKLIASYMD